MNSGLYDGAGESLSSLIFAPNVEVDATDAVVGVEILGADSRFNVVGARRT